MTQDIRQAFRQIAAHPGYSLVTVLTLGLRIGANTALFSLAPGVLLHPLPYAHGGTLARLAPPAPHPGRERASIPPCSPPHRGAKPTRGSRTSRRVSLGGGLNPGVPVAQPRAEVSTIGARLQREYPIHAVAGMTVTLAPVRDE